jgi:hypothetical protein
MLVGRGPMPKRAPPLVNGTCVPTISLFAPPTYLQARFRDVNECFGEAPREAESKAAAQPGKRQDVL